MSQQELLDFTLCPVVDFSSSASHCISPLSWLTSEIFIQIPSPYDHLFPSTSKGTGIPSTVFHYTGVLSHFELRWLLWHLYCIPLSGTNSTPATHQEGWGGGCWSLLPASQPVTHVQSIILDFASWNHLPKQKQTNKQNRLWDKYMYVEILLVFGLSINICGGVKDCVERKL